MAALACGELDHATLSKLGRVCSLTVTARKRCVPHDKLRQFTTGFQVPGSTTIGRLVRSKPGGGLLR
jgi:hypothetical protein